MATLTYAQITAPADYSLDADPSGAKYRAYYLQRKAALYNVLSGIGVTGVWSWATGSVPSSQMEMFGRSLADYDMAQALLAKGATSTTAEGDALDAVTFNVYGARRAPATYTTARFLLTDAAGRGPHTFSPTSKSVSAGPGGPRFDGLDWDGSGKVVIPKNGSAYLYARSESPGSEYSSLSVDTVTFFARGALAGVEVTNDSTWLSFSGAVAGQDEQKDDALRAQNAAQWGTLGTGSPAKAYKNWALRAAPNVVTRVAVMSNLDPLDPGRVDVLLAGAAGAVGPSTVKDVQDAIAAAQTGGERIPETARCVVSSATNHSITVGATIYVQGEYNTAAFQARVSADFATYAAGVEIGGGPLGVVSWERLAEILQLQAGTSAGIIYDVSDFSPSTDVTLDYNEVPVFTLNLTWQSV